MASRSDAEQILERNTSDGSPRLRQDKEERKEKRSNWASLVMLLVTAAVLGFAAFVWYSPNHQIVNPTASGQTVIPAVQPANPANGQPATTD